VVTGGTRLGCSKEDLVICSQELGTLKNLIVCAKKEIFIRSRGTYGHSRKYHVYIFSWGPAIDSLEKEILGYAEKRARLLV
jgi:hypothetical protein